MSKQTCCQELGDPQTANICEESIALDGTDVVGTIPEQFSSLSSLSEYEYTGCVHMFSHWLTQTLPKGQLRLNATGLTGTIPAGLGYLSKLGK